MAYSSYNPTTGDTSKTSAYRRRLGCIRNEQSSQGWLDHWKEVTEWLAPRRGRYLQGQNSTQDNDGRKKHQRIINTTGPEAAKILAAGLRGGLTSPSRPWFQLGLTDESLSEFKPVKEWLHTVRNILLDVISRSNFYGAIHSLYYELGCFGTNAMIIEEDPQTIFRCRPLTIGEFGLTLDSRYRPEALYRQFTMTACQMAEEFAVINGKYDRKKLPRPVLSALDEGNIDTKFEVVHVIEKNKSYDKDKADYRGKLFKSIYFPLSCGDEDFILRESGYRNVPFIGPRWDVSGVDVYGGCPGIDLLGDLKQVQSMEGKKLRALDKSIDPPVNAPVSLKNNPGVFTLPGGANFVDINQGQSGVSAAYLVQPRLADMRVDMQELERRIKDGFFNNLFLSVLNEEKQMTAYETAKRYEEKSSVLGPVMERLDAEALDPFIDRVFDICLEAGIIPPPPPDLKPGMPLKVDYISTLAQAQKMAETGKLSQTIEFVTAVAQTKGLADQVGIHKVDFDEMIDQFSTMLALPPKVVRSDDEVAEIAAEAEAKQKQMALMSQMQPAADAINKLANSPTQGGESTALAGISEAVAKASGRSTQ